MAPEDLQTLLTRTMPYGKSGDRVITDLSGDYLNWFARTGFPPGEIGQLLQLIDRNGLSSLLDPLFGKTRNVPTLRNASPAHITPTPINVCHHIRIC